jgi:hypothetical protein
MAQTTKQKATRVAGVLDMISGFPKMFGHEI